MTQEPREWEKRGYRIVPIREVRYTNLPKGKRCEILVSGPEEIKQFIRSVESQAYERGYEDGKIVGKIPEPEKFLTDLVIHRIEYEARKEEREKVREEIKPLFIKLVKQLKERFPNSAKDLDEILSSLSTPEEDKGDLPGKTKSAII